ncbi:hypothetical protein ACF3MZ_21265 [Paenibacillaceae bacterium WGS1546]|uniref:hypothetical protein n=1 Tax=Cohnella sp. WGS1546 TaxID=3366810 RepID=UPI00372D654A
MQYPNGNTKLRDAWPMWEANDREVKQQITAHEADQSNPHNVTAAQVGAETPAGAQAKADAVQSNLDAHEADTIVHVTEVEHEKLDGIQAGAEKNQNAYAQINGIVADNPSDELTIEGSTGIAVTVNPATKKVILTATGEAIPGPHGPSHDPDGPDPIPALDQVIDDVSDLSATVADNTDAIIDLAGVGRTTETVKGNADDIAAVSAEVAAQKADIANAVGVFTSDYPVLPPETNDTGRMQRAINAAAARNIICCLNEHSYTINGGLTTPEGLAGIVGIQQNKSTITVIDDGYTALTITTGVVYRHFRIVGDRNKVNGILFSGLNAGLGGFLGWLDASYLRTYNLDGFGIKIDTVYDSSFKGLSVELCGNADEYAFSVLSTNDTTNVSTFDRIQVERSYSKAMSIAASTLSCVFSNIHSERTTGDGTSYTHDLRGDSCIFNGARIESNTNVRIRLGGVNSQYNSFRCVGSDVYLEWFQNDVNTEINGLSCNNVYVLGPFSPKWVLRNIKVSALFDVANSNDVNVYDSYLSNVSVRSNGSILNLFDSEVSGTWSMAGNNEVNIHNSKLTNFPNMVSVYLDECTVTNAFNTGFNQVTKAHNCTFNGVVTLNSNGSRFYGYGCTFNADLAFNAGDAFGILDDNCICTTGTVNARWYGVPTAGTWIAGTKRYRPNPAAGGHIGTMCTAGGTPGTWKDFGAILA